MKTYNTIKDEILKTSLKITKAIAKGNIGKAEKLNEKLNQLIIRAANIKPSETSKDYYGVVVDSKVSGCILGPGYDPVCGSKKNK